LLKNQANVNLPNSHKQTPLMLAAEGGYAQICQMVLLAGADATMRNMRGQTVLMCAAMSGHATVCSIVLDFAADPSAVNPVDGSTALTAAAAHGNAEAYNVLMQAGSVVRPVDDDVSYLDEE